MATELMRVDHLDKYYGDWQGLHDINFSIHEGEVIALVGPSGSRKSTLIRTLNGLEPYQKGTITFEGKKVTPDKVSWQKLRQEIGMVFQSYDLFPNLTVMGNILLGPTKVQKRDEGEVKAEAQKLLERFELADQADAYPRQLSGGQKQRIAIIRALVMHPKLMLFDEVTASLDPEMVRGVLNIMQELAEKDHMTMIIVTHELTFAAKVADQVLFLEDGRLRETTSAKQFFTNPQADRAKEFLASMDY